MKGQYFSQETFEFLQQLSVNNNRPWFEENKQWYEEVVRTPALNFIGDMSYELVKLSTHFLAVPKKVGGSLMRVQRDVRFGRDKRPYKTNIGIQFRHVLGKDVHAPGFYFHIEPEGCFVGAGIWRPESSALGKIRDAIAEQGDVWLKVNKDKKFVKYFTPSGDSLTNPPRGYAKDHPQLEELKRKDFIAISPLSDNEVRSAKIKSLVFNRFQNAESYMKFLCKSLNLNY